MSETQEYVKSLTPADLEEIKRVFNLDLEEYVKIVNIFKVLDEEVEQWKKDYCEQTGNDPSTLQTCKVVLEKSKLKGDKVFDFSKKSFLETFDTAPFATHIPLSREEISEIIDQYYTPEEKTKIKILHKFKSMRKSNRKVTVKPRKSSKNTTKSPRKSTTKSPSKVSVKSRKSPSKVSVKSRKSTTKSPRKNTRKISVKYP